LEKFEKKKEKRKKKKEKKKKSITFEADSEIPAFFGGRLPHRTRNAPAHSLVVGDWIGWVVCRQLQLRFQCKLLQSVMFMRRVDVLF